MLLLLQEETGGKRGGKAAKSGEAATPGEKAKATPSEGRAEAGPSSSGPSLEEEFRPTAQMEEMIMVFLIRMTFVAAESQAKDKEMIMLLSISQVHNSSVCQCIFLVKP